MKELRYDRDACCHYVESGVLRIDIVMDPVEVGYHLEEFVDGEPTGTWYPATGVWTLDEAVEAAKDVAKGLLMGACGLVNELACLDMARVKKASEVVRDVEEEDE